MLKGLRRSLKVDELAPLLSEVIEDDGVASALTGAEAAVQAAFAKAGGGTLGERALLQFLEGCKLIRAVIVTMPGGAEGHADLTWQDASAAFQLCGDGADLDRDAFANVLALCGAVKYRDVPGMSLAKKVEGFIANVSGSQDEHAVIGVGK